MIKPTVIDWYIGEYNPKPAWMQATKARAYLPGILVETGSYTHLTLPTIYPV
ncbi:hypothetical protein GF516_11360 [Staphylococcus aureus]|nr:hypothetical protein [Staphylococcus aureus]